MTSQTSGPWPLRARGLVLVAGVALLGGVAACSPENIAERVIEAGSDGDVDVDIDDGDGKVTIDDGEGGTATFGGAGDLPDGFPDAVPVVKGDIIFSQSSSSDGREQYSVNIETSGTTADVFDRVKSDLARAGFEKTNESTVTANSGAFSSAQFTSDEWEVFVNVTSTEEEGSTFVTYAVSSAAG